MAQENLICAFEDNLILDEEFLLLYDTNQSKNFDLPYRQYTPFNLDEMEDDECLAGKKKITYHCWWRLLVYPKSLSVCREVKWLAQRHSACCWRGWHIPCLYSDMMQRFGQRPVPVLCMATNWVLDFIYDIPHCSITLSPVALQTYADCIYQMGTPLDTCFGFIDCTVWPVARPGNKQGMVHNGHKRVYSLKFQAVAQIPNGLITHLYGPIGKLYIIRTVT